MFRFRWFGFIFVLLLLALALSVSPARAGGWAIVVLDELPAQPTAGEPLTISFRVLQHGHSPTPGLTPIVRAWQDNGSQVRVEAAPGEAVGSYQATLELTEPGEWRWSIEAFGPAQEMPVLSVQPAAAAAAQAAASSVPVAARGLGIAALAAFALAGALALAPALGLRRRPRLAIGLAALAALLAVSGLYTATARATAQAEAPPAASADRSQAEVGRGLFLAKGCIGCHRHVDAEAGYAEIFSTGMGPNLTRYDGDPAFLRSWLKDPTAFQNVPKGGQYGPQGMPNLHLSEAEIEALSAFLLSD